MKSGSLKLQNTKGKLQSSHSDTLLGIDKALRVDELKGNPALFYENEAREVARGFVGCRLSLRTGWRRPCLWPGAMSSALSIGFGIKTSFCWHQVIKTTLSLDPDVTTWIEREVETSKKSMKAVINEKLRRGFAAKPKGNVSRSFELPQPLDLGRLKVQNFDNIAEILELIEDGSR